MSSITLGLNSRPPGVTTTDSPLAIKSNLTGNISPRILQKRLFACVAIVRENVDSWPTAAKKQHKYDYDKSERKKPVPKRIGYYLSTGYHLRWTQVTQKTTDKLTFRKVSWRADRLFRKFSFQQDPTINANRFHNTKSINRVVAALCRHSKFRTDKKRNAVEGIDITVDNNH